MKKSLLLPFLCLAALPATAQRQMETLDRGLVAVKTDEGVFASWRILGTEYYDTQYNLYRDGTKVNAEPLDVSNFTDADGTSGSTYTVTAIVRGTEQAPSKAATVWGQQYLEIPMGKIYSRRGTDITSSYTLNDATAADLDGDGEFEIIVKRIYSPDGLFDVTNDSAYAFFEAYKLDGTRMWSIDLGPNMISSGHVETNIIAFDWDQDGKAELVMRAADGTIIYDGNGERVSVVGSLTANYRDQISHTSNLTYATAGNEYLLYMEGATAKPYISPMEFPLKRLESGESDINAAWGDGSGHRANKFFFGAPYLDGRNPSIFMARGIYTRHKMIAYDVNPASHELVERWRWNDIGGAWFGQGYHNYGIADVDWDGRDEIVYGSMVIDDNGKGLSTTGLGHGDAQHCGDLDPYRKGQEIFACNENAEGANFRDATTSQLYYFHSYGRDCGRAMAGNFTDLYLGSQAVAPGMGLLSTATSKIVSDNTSGIDVNFRIYWDGDLCSETINGSGTEGPAVVHKYGSWNPIFTATGTKMNNWTKNTPSLQADILGDWREEMILRTDNDLAIRIYTTTDETPWRNYTLLHDMQYRQAVAWQMCGYNQPPHPSFFLGKAEGITLAPPPVMTNGRVEATSDITEAHNGQHVLLSSTEGGEVAVTDGASPYILTVNAFSHTQGNNNNDQITTTQTEYTLTGGALTGGMRLVKQGEGILSFGGEHTYSGPTELWGGTTRFDGNLPNSRVWMNRHTELDATGTLGRDVRLEYGAVLSVGGPDKQSSLQVDSLTMAFGGVLELDIYADGSQGDQLTITKGLTLETRSGQNGPKYSAPVFRFVAHLADGAEEFTPGKYHIANVAEVTGNISNVVIEGLVGQPKMLTVEDGQIYLTVRAARDPATVYWNGSLDNYIWDLASAFTFSNNGEADVFATGDDVIFDDAATYSLVRLTEDLRPSQLTFKNSSRSYTLFGDGYIDGETGLTKQGDGTIFIQTENGYTGKTLLEGGVTNVSSLGNSITKRGALGAYTTEAGKLEIRSGAVLANSATVTNGTPITIGTGGGTLRTNNNFTQQGSIAGGVLTKEGSAQLSLSTGINVDYVVLKEGSIRATVDNVNFGDTLVFAGNSTYSDNDDSYSYSTNTNNFKVNEGVTAYMYLDSRCNYTGRLYGKGKLCVNVPYVRSYLQGNWSAFEGTLEPINTGQTFSLDNSYGIPEATLNIPSGVYVGNTAKTFRIGKLTGSGTLGALCLNTSSGANTWQVGSLNEDFTFGGAVSGDGTKLEKVGSGKMTVTGVSDFTGACTVSEGTLCVNNGSAGSGMLGTGALNVKSGATLCGNGKLANSSVTVESGGLLHGGIRETATAGELDFSGKNLTVNAGGTLQLTIASATRCMKLLDIRTLALRGTLKIIFRSSSVSPTAGSTYQLWEANRTVIGDNAIIELPKLAEGLTWDTSELVNGKLSVVQGSSVGSTAADEEVACEIYTVGGAYAGQFTCNSKDIATRAKREGLAPGVYTVKVKAGKQTTVRKITVD